MKKLLLSLIGLVALSISAFGQADSVFVIGNGVTTTNNVAANATNTYSVNIDAVKSDNLCLLLAFTPQAATNDVVTFTFKPVDGAGNVSTVSAQWKVIPVTAVTNAQVIYITNFSLGGVPQWRLTSIGNTNGGAYQTNIFVKAITKTGI